MTQKRIATVLTLLTTGLMTTGLMTTGLMAAGSLCAASPQQAEQPAQAHSVWDGIYTAEQARRGEPLYYRECSTCHGDKLGGHEDAPPLAGPDFLDSWNGLTVGKLFDKIRLTMPKGEPGEVGVQQKADIVGYILSVNKFPAGKTELQKSDALKDIRFETVTPEGRTSNATSGPPLAASSATSKRLRIAVIQMKSIDHDIDGNLKRAETFVEKAAAQGANLVLLPEFMATGSYLSFDTWESAEPSQGKTVQWLKSTSGRLGVWLGTSFLEADKADFYDTFVLTTPQGHEAGRVRKQVPADAEAYFFRGAFGSHVIDTAIGKIGVGICAESYYCFIASEMRERSADLILMPHAAPDMSESGGLPSPPGTHLASWYAKKFGVPVAMVNKVGRTYKPPPNEIKGFFPGLSAIVDSDGTVRQSMDDKEGIGIADVSLDPSRKTGASVCTGFGGIAELTVGGAAGAEQVKNNATLGQKSYENNPLRRAKALEISGGQRDTTTGTK